MHGHANDIMVLPVGQVAARKTLPLLDGSINGCVQIQTLDELAGNLALLSQLMQCVLRASAWKARTRSSAK